MAAGLTIVEQAIQNLVTTLQGITTGNGYNRTVRYVARCEDTATVEMYPAIIVTEIGTDNDIRTLPYVFASVNLALSVYDQGGPGDSWTTQTKLLLSDIEHAIRTTWNRGGFAEMTEVTRTTLYDAPRDTTFVASECLVNIRTRYLYNDATAVSGVV